MENTNSFCISNLVDHITSYITNTDCESSSVIKVNSENLSVNGDLCFLPSLKVWKCNIQGEQSCNNQCVNILQHLLHVHDITTEGKTDEQVAEEAFDKLISVSDNWFAKIQKCIIRKERICLFLNRQISTKNIIQMAIEQGSSFGRNLPNGKIYSLSICADEQSELTNARLCLIKDVTERILRTQGYRMTDEAVSTTFIFTTKSQMKLQHGGKKYLCGVVKNSKTNAKETTLKRNAYVQSKIDELRQLNEHRLLDGSPSNSDNLLTDLASATINFEMLSVKPSRPVFVGNNANSERSTTNTKGVSFVLYNTARIATIVESYNERKLNGEYPPLPNVDCVDYSVLDREEEWEIIYNFILGYPRMIKDCSRHEPEFQTCPQSICLFLLRLCHKFSAYYRKVRILTEGRDHLIPRIVARLYMLRALQVVLRNSLWLLNINPVSRM